MKSRKLILGLFILLLGISCSANQDTVKVGSFIINMGVTPQTIGNGLKPYGLLYELLKTHKIPVWWVINSSKGKDGIDFSYNGTDYRGGTFIIPSVYMTAAVTATVNSWKAQGVVGTKTTSSFIVDVFMVLRFAPKWTLDLDNGTIAVDFFTNAGIPSTAYGGSSSAGWKTPAQLGACDDIFVMPHADPTWATHNNLYFWNLNFKGNIWEGCHAVSVLENTTDPGNTIKMNFLTTNGLVLFSSHTNGSKPFTYQNATDPVMQFMGVMDGAADNGSERQFLPTLTSAWRSTTIVGAYASVHPNIPSLSAGPAAVIAYGRGYGDTTRGFVLYQAGHDINNNMGATVSERVAAQRAFFNYSFYATTKTRVFDVTMSGAPPVGLINSSYNLSVTVPAYIDMGSYSIKWTSTGTGTFTPNDYSQNVTYTPTGSANRSDEITVTLSDGCGREFAASTVTYMSGVLAQKDIRLKAERKTGQDVELSWQSNQANIASYEIEKDENNSGFETVGVLLFKGVENPNYTFVDNSDNASQLYRLKVIDVNGNYFYSSIARVNGETRNSLGISVLGNPVRNNIKLAYHVSTPQNATIELLDTRGRRILQKDARMSPSTFQLQIELPSTIINGEYFLRVKTKDVQENVRILVQ